MLSLHATAVGPVELVLLRDVLPPRVDVGGLGPWCPAWWRPPLRLQWARGDGDAGVTVLVPFLERSSTSVRRPTTMLDEPDLLIPLDRRALRLLAPWEAPDGLGFRLPEHEREIAEQAWALIADRSRTR